MKVWVDHMRRSYDPYVYVECPVCEERWWYNPYASGEAGLKICRNNKNHQIKMVTALGGKFGTPKPVYKREVSGQTEQNKRRWKGSIIIKEIWCAENYESGKFRCAAE
jgi:hypothetical protein